MDTSEKETSALTNDWLTRLVESGYRVTNKIQAIIETIITSSRALDAVAIFESVRRQYPRLGLVTVYRTINKLEELGLVEHLHQEQGCSLVLRATQGHEHILVCSRCGKVAYFSGDDLKALSDQIAQKTGYVIQSHWLQLFGLCPECRAA
jgi:Fur family ferric uptake transcriptional regulator